VNVATPDQRVYDVIIIGGALAGASSAILLLRERPQLRVLIIEKSEAFTRRVGEATVEISAYFLGRVLGLTQYLNEAHLVKQGMRFWFANDHARSLEECSEIGGGYLARVPAYQVDRSTLDEEVLRRAQTLGAEVRRPAVVQKVELIPGGEQVVTIRLQGGGGAITPSPPSDGGEEAPEEQTHRPQIAPLPSPLPARASRGEGEKTSSKPLPERAQPRTIALQDQTEMFRARWVIDASGPAALLSRQNGWFCSNTAHPTTAVWSRWRGVTDWDGFELAQKFPKWSMACRGIRNTATNHFVGHGWWAWCIPLKGGDVSVGVVFDQRFVDWPELGSLGQRLKDFLLKHPAAREILQDAQWQEGDVHWRKQLPYSSTLYAGDGFVLVGDAGAFLDPFYSPGMDWLSFTVTRATDMILAQQRGESAARPVYEYNRDFTRSYDRWFEAIYQNKYEYLGDYELMRLGFLLDLGLYYLGIASQPYKRGVAGVREPVFTTAPSVPFYHLMRAYNRRLASIARCRRARGTWGRHNANRRFMFGGYTFSPASSKHVLKALLGWGWLEMTEGWRSWFVAKAAAVVSETPKPVPAPAGS
jgi:flavin-dependent dehydrogenase